MDVAVEAMKAGAFDFLSKPVALDGLRKLVNAAIQVNRSAKAPNKPSSRLVGQSGPIRALESRILKLARSQAPVYISGESGSGKELVARSIHELGPRQKSPFVAVNCGAIPSELMESEFFGHKKGSFTGAHQDKNGLFKAAEGGTLFLDEVADLPLDMQVKLLRAIQEKAVRPIGGSSEVQIDVRILSATHKNLEQQVAEGHFRQDLFYRLNVIQLKVPPLRERQEDIPLLAKHLLDKLAKEMALEAPILLKTTLEVLKSYAFPGNVRELENILERAFTLCDSEQITPDDLQLNPEQAVKASSSDTTQEASGNKISHYARCDQYDSMDEYLAEIEKDILLEALESVRWNKTMAAKKLGITFRSLRYRLQKLGLDND